MKAWMLLVVLCAPAAAVAGEVDASIDRADQKTMSSKAFLDAHPDLKYRTEGWLAYEAGEFAHALSHFREAAGYGDRLSQAMLAEMLWEGHGQPVDRPMAYAWADLAAERGYAEFVVLRERLWAALEPAERARAVADGSSLVAQYGDAATSARLAEHLRKARRYMTGKRPRRDAMIIVPGEKGGLAIRGSDFYAAKFWEPERYQAWVDAQWEPLPRGNVDVRALEVVRDGAAQGAGAGEDPPGP